MNKPVSVLRVLTRLNVGGPARQAVLLDRHLRPEYDTTLAAGRVLPGEAELDHEGINVVPVSLERPIRPARDVRACLQIQRLLGQTGARILHSHMAKAGATSRLAARLGPRRGVRTVHTFHGHVFDGYFSSRAEQIFIRIERGLARRTDVLVAVSTEIRDQLLDLGIGRPSQYRVIPEGQDLDPYLEVDRARGDLRRAVGIEPTVPLIGVLGRLVPIKDHVTLLDAMVQLDEAHLAVLGDGELRASLERRAADCGLSRRVHFVGWTNDVAGALSDLDVVVLTSRNEGTPVALIEALAAARPVVATDVGGVRSVVEEGVTGFLAAPGDAPGIADAVRRLLRNPSLRSEMGRAGRAVMRDRYGPERLVRETRELYAELLS